MTTLSPRSHLRAIAASSLYFTPRYDPPLPTFPAFRERGLSPSLFLPLALLLSPRDREPARISELTLELTQRGVTSRATILSYVPYGLLHNGEMNKPSGDNVQIVTICHT